MDKKLSKMNNSISSSYDEDEDQWFIRLKEWILSNGGKIHQSLTMKDIHNTHATVASDIETAVSSSPLPSNNEKSSTVINRGIFASSHIPKGELLISLPSKLIISGEKLPHVYVKKGEFPVRNGKDGNKEGKEDEKVGQKLNASPWLRCISAFMEANLKLANSLANKTEQHPDHYGPYINSLPSTYDTLLQTSSWSNDEIEQYLSGTTIGKMVLQDRQSQTLQNRYKQSIEPYLRFNHIIDQAKTDSVSSTCTNNNESSDDEINQYYSLFEKACACISSRGFHLKKKDENIDAVNVNIDLNEYSGPFLLPFIDLLNHSSSISEKCTTLQRGRYSCDGNDNYNNTTNGSAETEESFFMIAERSIEKGEEILHSYGDNLTSGQSLQTFGFVEDKRVQRAMKISVGTNNSHHTDMISTTKTPAQSDFIISHNNSNNNNVDIHDLTPAMLSKKEILQACWKVSSSSYPNELKHFLQEKYSSNQNDDDNSDSEDMDEFWDLPQNVECREKDTVNIIPNEIVIHAQGFVGEDRDGANDILSDELITLCSIQFLPDDAYKEIIGEKDEDDAKKEEEQNHNSSLCLLTKEILDDYYLGKLVLKSIILAIEEKLKEYIPINIAHCGRKNYEKQIKLSSGLDADRCQLQELIEKKVLMNEKEVQHVIYSLTIRIEEKICLHVLKRRVLELIDSLDDDDDDDKNNADYLESVGSSSKRIKL